MKYYILLANVADYAAGNSARLIISDSDSSDGYDGCDGPWRKFASIDIELPPRCTFVEPAVEQCEAAIKKIEEDAARQISEIRTKMEELKALPHHPE